MSLMTTSVRRAAVAGIVAALSACNGPPDSKRFGGAAPPAESFGPVSAALEIRCGTLDCHGSAARNLVFYGINGFRLDPTGITGDQSTTAEEVLATYESLVALQPEVLDRIMRDGGARPERWLVVTKGRGTEAHKGGSRMIAGDDTDTCLASWLRGQVDIPRCETSADLTPPGGEAF